MSLEVDVSTAVDRFSQKIGFWQPLYEAISNALEANASEIVVEIEPAPTLHKSTDQVVAEITVQDNGDGFTEANIKSFCKLWTKHKSELGCRGVGRLTWLRVFNKVSIASRVRGKNIAIEFNRNFEPGDVIRKKSTSSQKRTIVKFAEVTSKFFDPNQKFDKRGHASATAIRDLVAIKLAAKLFLLKKENQKSFSLKFKVGKDIATIDSETLLELREKHFSIPTANDLFDFTLYYAFIQEHKNEVHHDGYCASGRIVKQFDKELRLSNLPDNHSSIMLLTSNYFDSRVNDERNEFVTIKDGEETLDSPITFATINREVNNNMQLILQREFPELVKNNAVLIDECVKEYPHLQDYFVYDQNIIKDKASLVKNALSEFNAAKENTKISFRKLLVAKDFSYDEFSKVVANISNVSANELAEYIAYRQQIIEALHQLNDDKPRQEALLHELFMNMRADSFSRNIFASNIWLLDDKFMNYFYLASDKDFSAIRKAMKIKAQSSSRGRYRPDLFGVYLRDRDITRSQDVVMIEFKGLGATNKNKREAIVQISDNVATVKKLYPSIKTVWSFIITHIDEEFSESLENNMFKPFLNIGAKKIYRSYNDKLNNHCFAISIDALLSDAMSRNSIFLDIITNNYTDEEKSWIEENALVVT